MGSRFSRFDNKIKDILSKDSEVKNFEVIDKIFKSENIKYNRGDSKAFSKYLTRFRKRLTENYDGIFDATDSLDIDNQNVKHLWVKNKQASVFVKNPNFVQSELANINQLRDDLIKDLQQYAPKFPKLERIENKDSYLLFFSIKYHLRIVYPVAIIKAKTFIAESTFVKVKTKYPPVKKELFKSKI